MTCITQPPMTSLRKWLLIAEVAVFGLLFAAVNGTWAYSTPSRALDGSWAYVLHHLAGTVHFGSELIFTYGPLGFLITLGDTPSTYVWRMAFEFILLLFVYWLMFITRFRGTDALPLNAKNSVIFFLAGPIGVSWAFLGNDTFPDGTPMLALVLGILSLFRLSSPEQRPYRVLICFVLASLALAKGTLIFAVGLLALLLLVRKIIFRQGSLDSVVALLGFFVLLWLISGNTLTELPRFLWAIKEIASGFSTGMQMDGAHHQQVRALFLILSLTLGVRYGLASGTNSLDRYFFGILIIFLGLTLTKHATDRFDGHVFPPTHVMLAMSVLPLCFPRPSQTAKYFSVAAFVLALLLLNFALKSQRPGLSPIERIQTIYTGDRFIPHLQGQWILFPNIINSIHEQVNHFNKTNRTLGQGLPEVPPTQSVDIYSFKQGALLAQQLNYHPRPVFQSYSAYTPWLAEQNRNFLRSAQAPERIFFAIEPIDLRLASMEDGLSWFDLIARYQLNGAFSLGGTMHLDLLKKAIPSSIKLVPAANQLVDIGSWYEPPEQKILWASARATDRSLGKNVAAQLIKSPIYWLDLELANGQVLRRRVIEPMMTSGFLLSPMVDSTKDFANMVTAPNEPRTLGKHVKRFRIMCNQEGRCPVSQWNFSFTSASIDLDPSWNPQTLHASGASLGMLLEKLQAGVATDSNAQIQNEDNKKVLLAHAPTTIVVSAEDIGIEQATKIKVCYGILRRAYEQDGATDGVDFEIQEATDVSERQAIWSRSLKPQQTAHDKGEQCTTIPLSGKQSGLVLITKPGSNNAWDWSYWSNLERVK